MAVKAVGYMNKRIETFADYMADESRVSPALREKIKIKVELMKKRIEIREAIRGGSQSEKNAK